MKIKKGDTVVVISGKDKGKEGTVSRVMPSTNQIIVDGINVVKKHQKPSGTNQQGGIIDRDMPLDASNVMLLHKGKSKVKSFYKKQRSNFSRSSIYYSSSTIICSFYGFKGVYRSFKLSLSCFCIILLGNN